MRNKDEISAAKFLLAAAGFSQFHQTPYQEIGRGVGVNKFESNVLLKTVEMPPPPFYYS